MPGHKQRLRAILRFSSAPSFQSIVSGDGELLCVGSVRPPAAKATTAAAAAISNYWSAFVARPANRLRKSPFSRPHSGEVSGAGANCGADSFQLSVNVYWCANKFRIGAPRLGARCIVTQSQSQWRSIPAHRRLQASVIILYFFLYEPLEGRTMLSQAAGAQFSPSKKSAGSRIIRLLAAQRQLQRVVDDDDELSWRGH